MDSTQWPQDIGNVKQVENSVAAVGGQEKKPRPEKQEALNCPRCNSTNTKFCYYNNYSLTQPRYFCKTCRRYWTAGGSLRTVPVGGGSRKNKRTSSSSISSNFESSSKKATIPDLKYPQKISTQNPKFHQGQDLNLAYNGISEFVVQNPNAQLGLMNSFMSIPVSDSYSSGFSLNDQFKLPSLSFSLDLENGYENNLQGVVQDNTTTTTNNNNNSTNTSRFVFPFEELKPAVTTNESFDQQNKGQGELNGYWNGMLAGGSW
ncbi:hypothetical protein ACJIZ3_022639 [Penstemon smallii]|uniref:Dof zinc finger protein n=1 Tax=Penstemon smallii TaxID=265156 RepID=A0ABD3TP46_9LAMI